MHADLQALLVACVVTMMLCVGLDFPVSSWRSLLRNPLPLWVGLAAQNLVVPLVGFAVALLFHDQSEIALGIVLIVAAPGGPIANAMVHFAGARIDISVSLTVINALASLVTVPLIASTGFALLAAENAAVRLPVAETLAHIVFIIVMPIVSGFTIQRIAGQSVARISRFARAGTGVMMTLILVIVCIANAQVLISHFSQMVPAALTLCLAMLTCAHLFSRFSHLDAGARFAIANESSVHNVPLALIMAEEIIHRPDLAAMIAVYAQSIGLLTLAWALIYRRRLAPAHPPRL